MVCTLHACYSVTTCSLGLRFPNRSAAVCCGSGRCAAWASHVVTGRHALKLGASSRDLRPRKDETAFLELPLQTSKIPGAEVKGIDGNVRNRWKVEGGGMLDFFRDFGRVSAP